MTGLSVVYYTANREAPDFEAKVLARLRRQTIGLPLITVSQQPLPYPQNVCVGDVGVSMQNVYRQAHIGVGMARTQYVALAESDCLYPDEYFTLRPKPGSCVVADPVWVLYALRGKVKVYARKTMPCEGAIVCEREVLLEHLERALAGFSKWGDGYPPWVLDGAKWERVMLGEPVLTFKTSGNQHRKTAFSRESQTRDLPPFGPAHLMIREWLS